MCIQAAKRAEAYLAEQLEWPGQRPTLKYLPMRLLTVRPMRVFDLMTGQEAKV